MTGETWTDLVSAKVGLVTDLSPQVRGPEEPLPPYLYTATLAHFDFRSAKKADRLAAGKGWTKRAAILSALGEAVERYCAYHWDPQRTYLAKWSQVRDSAISPADCVLYSEEQYRRPNWRYRRWHADEDVTWIRGIELSDGHEIALPASLVYLVQSLPRIEDFFAPATSNGLAAGSTLNGAILSGIYELIERDALLITWMNRLPAIEIVLSAEVNAAASVVRHYARFGVEVRCFQLPTDQSASVVMAIAFDADPQRPACLIGMGCDLDPANAVGKAICELCQARPSESNRYRENPPAGRLQKYEDVLTLEDHPAFLSLPQNATEFSFLWTTGEKQLLAEIPNRSTGTINGNLGSCVEALTKTGHPVAYVELTAPDVALVGYRVVRTIAAGLQPIHFGCGEERLGGRRLFELPHRLGFSAAPRTVSDLNRCPHPLA